MKKIKVTKRSVERGEYTKNYNARPKEVLKRKLWRKSLLSLRKNHKEEFKKIYYALLEENSDKIGGEK